MNKKIQLLRALLMGFPLLFAVLVQAQQPVFDANIKYQKEGKLYLYDGKPMNGCYKVSYIDEDFVRRYYIANFKKGLQGDTVRHYDAKSNALINESIRLNDRETLHRNFFFDGKRFEEYRTTDKGREGIYREWYQNGNGRRACEYAGGALNGISTYWDENWRLMEVVNYKNNLQVGWSETYIYEDSQSEIPAKIVRDLYDEDSSPVLEERYNMGREGPVLVKRTIFNSPYSEPKYMASKNECDSTRIDSLENSIEICDYRQGKLQYVERYNYDWTPNGIFEYYYPEGEIEARKRYERGEVVAEAYYSTEPRTDIRQITLASAACAALKQQSFNSKYFDKCDEKKPLVISNRYRKDIFYVGDEDRRYEYYGYDPKSMLHFAFSSIGDFYKVCYYVVHDDGTDLTLSADCVAVSATGYIAAVRQIFDDENELIIYQYVSSDEEGSFFIPIFTYVMQNSQYVTNLHWVGNNALLLEYENGGIRLDIDPNSLEPDDELY